MLFCSPTSSCDWPKCVQFFKLKFNFRFLQTFNARGVDTYNDRYIHTVIYLPESDYYLIIGTDADQLAVQAPLDLPQ